MIFLGWIVFSFVVGFIGSQRKIGFAGAFFLSLMLSPILGLIITLVSKDKGAEQYQEQVLKMQQLQTESLLNIQEQQSAGSGQKSVPEELDNLLKMKEAGYLTEVEYQKAKIKVIS